MLGISDPRPGLDDGQFDQWLALLPVLATASGLPRRPPRPQTLPEQWAYKPDMSGPMIAGDHATSGTIRGTGREGFVGLRAGLRVIDIPYHVPVDPMTGEPISSHAPGSEVVLSAYRDREIARLLLDESHRRRYVPGWSLPAIGLTERCFGPPEARFRSFTIEPYFPDETAGFYYVGRDRTQHNSYQIGKRVA